MSINYLKYLGREIILKQYATLDDLYDLRRDLNVRLNLKEVN